MEESVNKQTETIKPKYIVMNITEIVDVMKLYAPTVVMTLVVVGTLLGMRYIPRLNRQKKVSMCGRLTNHIYHIPKPDEDFVSLACYNRIVTVMKKHKINSKDFGVGDMQALRRQAITVFRQAINTQGILLHEQIVDAEKLMRDVTEKEAYKLQIKITLMQKRLGDLNNELREFLSMTHDDGSYDIEEHPLVPIGQY